MTIMSGGTAIYAAHYFLGRPTGHFGEHFPILLAHITGGSVAMLVARMQFSHAYVIVSWLCWVPNLLVAEWLLRRPASQVNHFSPERVF
jgi:hypothetical protein